MLLFQNRTDRSFTRAEKWIFLFAAVFGNPLTYTVLYYLPLFSPIAAYQPFTYALIGIPLVFFWMAMMLYMAGSLAGGVARKDKLVIKQRGVFLVTGLTALIVVLSPINIKAVAYDRVIQKGDRLVTALKRYKNDNGRYPERLSELDPAYITHPSSTGTGISPNFEYRIPEKGGFILAFDTDLGLIFERLYYDDNQTKEQDAFTDNYHGNWYIFSD